jgi:membrane protease YdiL (CAAX protease family)
MIERIIPLILFLALWLVEWFASILMLPSFLLLFLYVIFIEKKAISNLGFHRAGLQYSLYLGSSFSMLLMAVYYFAFVIHYFDIGHEIPSIFEVFTNVIWLSLYEEVVYRGFFLSHFSDSTYSAWTKRNFVVNLFQSVLYLSIYLNYAVNGAYFMLVPMFLLGIINGIIFQKIKNIYGCLILHSIFNAFTIILNFV